MSYAIKNLQVKGLHGYLNFDINFNKGLNVILGKNGSGKTTIANVISHLMKGDFYKFLFVDFESIEFEFFDGYRYKLKKEESEKIDSSYAHYHGYISIENLSIKSPPVINKDNICTNNPQESQIKIDYLSSTKDNFWYWPANRFIDELEDNFSNREQRNYYRGRDLHEISSGKFSAKSSYKTFGKIESEIQSQYLYWLSSKSKKSESAFEKITEIINNQSDDNDSFFSIKEAIQKTYDEVDDLANQSVKPIDEFLEKVNSFLNSKYLKINKVSNNKNPNSGFMGLYSKKDDLIGYDRDIFYCLSAGERQFIPMIYQAIVSIELGCLIIDEPEISLDVEWQAELGRIFSKKKNCQIICFTHSYSFSESFDWGEDTFYLKNEKNMTILSRC